MHTIIDSIFSDSAFPFLLIAYMTMSLFFVFVQLRKQTRAKGTLKEGFELLEKGFTDNTIHKDDIELIYRKTIQPYINISYVDFLEKFQISILKSKSPEFIQTYGNRVKEIINEEKLEKPFDGVKEHEKRLLISIEESTKNGEISNISFTLSELARVLQTREKSYKSVKRMNSLSIPLAIVGLAFTLIFGLRSPKAHLSSDDIEYIMKVCNVNKVNVDSIRNLDITQEK